MVDIEHLKLALTYNAEHSEEHANRLNDGKFFAGKAMAYRSALLLIDMMERGVITEHAKKKFKQRMKKDV